MGKTGALVGLLIGAAAGVGATYFVMSPQKLRIYVNAELCTYIGTLLPDALYNPLFDANKDGRIDMRDVNWFITQIGTWVELPV